MQVLIIITFTIMITIDINQRYNKSKSRPVTGKLTFDFRIIALRCIHHQAKTALDMEIAVYRKLVECEEDRLGITASEDDVDLICLKSTFSNFSDSSFDPSDSDWEPTSPSYSRVRKNLSSLSSLLSKYIKIHKKFLKYIVLSSIFHLYLDLR